MDDQQRKSQDGSSMVDDTVVKLFYILCLIHQENTAIMKSIARIGRAKQEDIKITVDSWNKAFNDIMRG